MKLRHPTGKNIAITLIIALLLASFAIPVNAAIYTYDQLNRLTSVTYENGLELTYTYDAGGNITSVSHSEGTPGLTVKSTVPEDKAANVPVDQDISVIFSVYVQPGSAYDNISVQDAAYNPVDIIKSIAADTVTIDPLDNLDYSTRYTVTVPACSVTDIVYNDLRNDYSFTFITGTAQETAVPAVISTVPARDDTGVPLEQDISVTFNVYIQTGITYDNISVLNAANKPVAITKTINEDTLTINPKTNLKYNTLYTVTIPARAVTDDANNDLQADYGFSFTTKDRKAPKVTAADPANKTSDVPVDKTITVTFSEKILIGETFDSISLHDNAGNSVVFTKNIAGAVLTIDPVADLNETTVYTLKIPAGAVKDTSGNSLGNGKTFKFTTWDKTQPAVNNSDPVNDAVGVPVNKTISVVFTENIQAGVAYGNIAMEDAQGNHVDIKTATKKGKITINPESKLNFDTHYTVTIPACAVQDISGNDLADDFTLSFTTRARK